MGWLRFILPLFLLGLCFLGVSVRQECAVFVLSPLIEVLFTVSTGWRWGRQQTVPLQMRLPRGLPVSLPSTDSVRKGAGWRKRLVSQCVLDFCFIFCVCGQWKWCNKIVLSSVALDAGQPSSDWWLQGQASARTKSELWPETFDFFPPGPQVATPYKFMQFFCRCRSFLVDESCS